MSELTNLVAKQNEESYQLGKKHGAIEELEKIKIELFNSAYHNRISGKEQIFVIWEAVEAILNEDISELKGE